MDAKSITTYNKGTNMFKNFLRKDEIVKCEECKCILYKKDAQEIKINYYDDLFYEHNSELYYCPQHKKPYDIIHLWDYKTKSYYRKNVKVDEKGKVLKN